MSECIAAAMDECADSSTSCTGNNLPNAATVPEIVCRILLYLPLNQRIQVESVCQVWRNVSRSICPNNLVLRLDFENPNWLLCKAKGMDVTLKFKAPTFQSGGCVAQDAEEDQLKITACEALGYLFERFGRGISEVRFGCVDNNFDPLICRAVGFIYPENCSKLTSLSFFDVVLMPGCLHELKGSALPANVRCLCMHGVQRNEQLLDEELTEFIQDFPKLEKLGLSGLWRFKGFEVAVIKQLQHELIISTADEKICFSGLRNIPEFYFSAQYLDHMYDCDALLLKYQPLLSSIGYEKVYLSTYIQKLSSYQQRATRSNWNPWGMILFRKGMNSLEFYISDFEIISPLDSFVDEFRQNTWRFENLHTFKLCGTARLLSTQILNELALTPLCNIRALHLRWCIGDVLSFACLKEFKCLEELHLCGASHLRDVEFIQILRQQKLTRLYVEQCPLLSSQSMVAAFDWLPKLKVLEFMLRGANCYSKMELNASTIWTLINRQPRLQIVHFQGVLFRIRSSIKMQQLQTLNGQYQEVTWSSSSLKLALNTEASNWHTDNRSGHNTCPFCHVVHFTD